MKKYEFTEETKIVNGITLHRIKAIRDFSFIKAGDLGGFIEKEENLSHDGNCWIYDSACVYGNAKVSENATLHDKCKVFDKSFIYRNASICGDAIIRENASIGGDAIIRGQVEVYGYTHIEGHAKVYENAKFCNVIIAKSWIATCIISRILIQTELIL